MIFISYSSYDLPRAIRLVRSLRRHSFDFWIDRDHLNLRLPVVPQLRNAIARSSFVCLLDSLRARKSWWVQYELALQAEMQKPIVVISLNDERARVLALSAHVGQRNRSAVG